MPYFEPNYSSKMRSTDRIFVLEKKEGEHTKSTTGMVDNRLFTGDNKLHAKQDPQNSSWYLQYDSGILPAKLQGRWTSFNKLREHVSDYFSKRNINIKEILE